MRNTTAQEKLRTAYRAQDADKLANSQALNAELVQKLNELHQLLNQLHDQSILRAMEKVQEALKKMNPQDLERAMANMKLTQEDVVKNLEKTIELLKQTGFEADPPPQSATDRRRGLLVRSIQDAEPDSLFPGQSLLDMQNWDLRMLYALE